MALGALGAAKRAGDVPTQSARHATGVGNGCPAAHDLNQGHVYRVTLIVERAGGGAVDFEEESDLNADPSVRAELLANVFKRAASRLRG